ncbi:MAG: muramidase, partial [Pedobacter sp.]
NNHFGVKGKNNLMKTKGIRTAYKQYTSVASSYAAFCQLLSRKKFYSKLKGDRDYKKWIIAISNAGYSTAPVQWRQKVTQAIKKYKLAD